MTIAEFQKALGATHPPENIPDYLQALWFDAKGDWEKAHRLVDSMDDKNACWVHAYLHRREGDLGNARYWYNLAGKQMPDYPLEKEWGIILENLLA
jgi:hypothetical protein